MANTVIIGAQWGDEGKAKITDLLAEDADVIIRYQGGCNAGHTVVVKGETYKFHLIPSGVLYDNKECFIGTGTVINPEVLCKEIDDLIKRGIKPTNLKISPLAHITMPYHLDLDGASEKALGENKIGTTKRGIGPTYSDKINRCGFRLEDLYDEETLNEKIDLILPAKNILLDKVYGLKIYTKKEILDYCNKYAELLKPFVCFDMFTKLKTATKDNKRILFEGAQGTLLDIDYGTYPYVTSSNPVAGGATTGSGLGPTVVQEAIGVSKAYLTRVGEGPFVTELHDKTGTKIQDIGHEYGTTTGRKRRCGWFDAVVARYSVLVNGLTSMAITKLDVFDTFDEIKVCIAYEDERTGKRIEDYPTNANTHKYMKPIYNTFKGWNQDITNITKFEELPQNAQEYIKEVEKLIDVKVSIVSVGPGREQTIILENPMTK